MRAGRGRGVLAPDLYRSWAEGRHIVLPRRLRRRRARRGVPWAPACLRGCAGVTWPGLWCCWWPAASYSWGRVSGAATGRILFQQTRGCAMLSHRPAAPRDVVQRFARQARNTGKYGPRPLSAGGGGAATGHAACATARASPGLAPGHPRRQLPLFPNLLPLPAGPSSSPASGQWPRVWPRCRQAGRRSSR